MADERAPVRLFDPASIAIATFLGSPLAGAALWAINESRVGRPRNAVVAMLVGATVMAGMVGLGALDLPQGISLGITIGTTVGARQAAIIWDLRLREEGVVGEIAYVSRWVAAGAGMLGCLGVIAAVFAFVSADTGLGTSAVEGDPCTGQLPVCAEESATLWCEGGTYRRIGCSRGCDAADGDVECLQEEGDVCVGSTTQCYADDRLLGCVSGRMTLIALCQGPEGCFDGECDQSIGAEGTLCRMSSEARACTEDGTTLLRCDQVFQVVSPCDGPLGCHADGPNVMCDRLAAPDAP